MADALCGPSNALQTFKSHVQSDRSLQQDRFHGPRTATQGFRTHDPRVGSLDADFAAFENAQANPFLESAVSNDFRLRSHPEPLSPTGWTSDFQNLHLSDHPLPPQQFRAHAPLVKSMNGGWQNEFMRQQQQQQQQQNAQISSSGKGKQVAFDQQNVSGYTPQMQYTGGFGAMSSFDPQTTTMHQSFEHVQPQENHHLEGADWSQAFEDAFQDAFKDAEQQFDQRHETTHETTHEIQKSDQPIEPLVETQQPEQIRIGSDAIEYTETKDQTAGQEQQDASALARVAGELLHNVQHDNSTKFQNSQFLDLMRKIRDRQVEVRNNDFENTSSSASGALRDDQRPVSPHQHQPELQTQLLDTDTGIDTNTDADAFTFPDMDQVYTSTDPSDPIEYSFDSDQFPTSHAQSHYYAPAGEENQISHLHPGGRLYPGQSPPPATSVTTADFEGGGFDENRSFAQRFMR